MVQQKQAVEDQQVALNLGWLGLGSPVIEHQYQNATHVDWDSYLEVGKEEASNKTCNHFEVTNFKTQEAEVQDEQTAQIQSSLSKYLKKPELHQ